MNPELVKLLDFISAELGEKYFMHKDFYAWLPYHYKYASGREGDWFRVGVAERKNTSTVYICETKGDQYIAEIYKHELKGVKCGKSCIPYKSYEQINYDVLKKMLEDVKKCQKK